MSKPILGVYNVPNTVHNIFYETHLWPVWLVDQPAYLLCCCWWWRRRWCDSAHTWAQAWRAAPRGWARGWSWWSSLRQASSVSTSPTWSSHYARTPLRAEHGPPGDETTVRRAPSNRLRQPARQRHGGARGSGGGWPEFTRALPNTPCHLSSRLLPLPMSSTALTLIVASLNDVSLEISVSGRIK